MAMTPTGPKGKGMWRVDLICCGHDDGHIVRSTWEEADGFRNDYTTPQPHIGHERQGILRRDDKHQAVCNGTANLQPCPL